MNPPPEKDLEPSDELIPSRSNLTDSSQSYIGMKEDEDFADPIFDEGLGDSDHPSETYKNSLRLPFGYSSGGSFNKN